MKSTLFLATLVAFSLLQGCYALTGCPGSPQCDPNYVADGGNTGDASSSPETNVGNDSNKVAETNDPLAACPPEFKARINGVNRWFCGKEIECKLVLGTLNNGKYCAVGCPTKFTVKVPDQAKFVSDTELAYQVPNFDPESCILITN